MYYLLHWLTLQNAAQNDDLQSGNDSQDEDADRDEDDEVPSIRKRKCAECVTHVACALTREVQLRPPGSVMNVLQPPACVWKRATTPSFTTQHKPDDGNVDDDDTHIGYFS